MNPKATIQWRIFFRIQKSQKQGQDGQGRLSRPNPSGLSENHEDPSTHFQTRSTQGTVCPRVPTV